MDKILIIQTAFIGDVILGTALVEKLHQHFPDARIDFLLRKGNERLLEGHPYIHEVLTWNKTEAKYRNLWKIGQQIREGHYHLVINLQRFFSTGFLTIMSRASQTAGFDKNPLSFLFSHRVPHVIGTVDQPVHEVERNLSLIAKWTDNQFIKPKLYPSSLDFAKVSFPGRYITISPASVWFTKQWPMEKWIALMDRVGEETSIFLLGGKSDLSLCETIQSRSIHPAAKVLAGQLSFLESAALMKGAVMNYVNDSAPLHLASGVNAPVTAVFCSTIAAFGFTPLSDDSTVLETSLELPCRPCGLHGKKACPEGHFHCAEIDIEKLLAKLR